MYHLRYGVKNAVIFIEYNIIQTPAFVCGTGFYYNQRKHVITSDYVFGGAAAACAGRSAQIPHNDAGGVIEISGLLQDILYV